MIIKQFKVPVKESSKDEEVIEGNQLKQGII